MKIPMSLYLLEASVLTYLSCLLTQVARTAGEWHPLPEKPRVYGPQETENGPHWRGVGGCPGSLGTPRCPFTPVDLAALALRI